MERKLKILGVVLLLLVANGLFAQEYIEKDDSGGNEIQFRLRELPELEPLDESVPGKPAAWVIFWDFGDNTFDRDTIETSEMQPEAGSSRFFSPYKSHTYFQNAPTVYTVSASATPIYSKVDEPELSSIPVNVTDVVPPPGSSSLFSPSNLSERTELYFDWPTVRQDDRIRIFVQFRALPTDANRISGYVFLYAPENLLSYNGYRLANELENNHVYWEYEGVNHNGHDYFAFKVDLGPPDPNYREAAFVVELEADGNLDGIESITLFHGFYDKLNPGSFPVADELSPGNDFASDGSVTIDVTEANDPNDFRVTPDVILLDSELQDPCDEHDADDYTIPETSYDFDFELDIRNEGDAPVRAILIGVDLDDRLNGAVIDNVLFDASLDECIFVEKIDEPAKKAAIINRLNPELVPRGIDINEYSDPIWLVRPARPTDPGDFDDCRLAGVLAGFGNLGIFEFRVNDVNLQNLGLIPGDQLVSDAMVLFLRDENITNIPVDENAVIDATIPDPAVTDITGPDCPPEIVSTDCDTCIVNIPDLCCEKPQQKNWGIKAGLDFGIPFQDNNDLAGGNFFGFTYSNYFQSFGSDKPSQLNGWYGLEMLIHQMKVADGSQAILQLDFPFSLGYSVVRKDLLNIAGSVGFTPNILLNKQELDANTLFINNYIGWTVFSNLNATTAFGTDTPFSLGARLNYVYKKLAAEYPSLYTQISLNIGFGG